ncbi:MAG: tandem-95 repeat protein [Rhizobium sp.]|nr:tandem-95 repeat protein [Rhizobium sp.]
MSKSKASPFARLGFAALALAAGLLPVLAEASSTIRSFDQRYQFTGRADSTLVGNQLLNCSAAASGCTSARNGTGNNNNFNMGYVDVDADGATFNSSTATLSLPAGSTVLRAYLYWGADTSGGSGGTAAPTPANRGQVRLSAAGGGYTTVSATTIDATGNRYSGIADVTALVVAAGNGAYAVANVQAGTGQDRYAGWGLVVIYANASLPLRSLTLFDGSLNINASAPNSITTPVSGFRTPSTGAVDARIGLIAFEGDNNFTGDQFLVNGSNISDALNPTTNIFNSTNSRLGVAQSGRNPLQSNMLGFDIDYIPVAAGVIANNDTSASLTFTTSSETYYPIALLFQTNVYEPEIVTNFSKAATDVNGGEFRPGDILEYTISLSNTGDDASDQTVITDPLPLGLTYVPGTIEVLTGPNAGAKTDAPGDDQAEYDAGSRTVTVRVGTSADAATGGRVTPVPQANSSTSLRFRAQIDPVQPDGAALSNIAGISYVGATSGTPATGSSSPSTVNVSRDADLAISKTGPANVAAGGPLQYVLTVTSLGPDAADGATVTDNMPAGITGVSITCAATGGAVCPDTTGLTTLSALAVPTFPSGGQLTFTIDGTAPAAATTLSNTGTVGAPAGTNDPTPGNNSAGPVDTTVQAALDLATTGTLTTAGTIRTGDAVAYAFTVTNNGPVAATGAPFALPMPSGLAGASWTCAPVPACGTGSGTGDIALSLTLANGEALTINITGTAPATTPATIGAATGTVSAPAGLSDTDASNDSATVPAITVQARDVVATNDSGTVANGAAGGTAVANVLANDTLDGNPATLATVSLSQVSTTNPNVTLDPATGVVIVAPGTPSGSYTVVYQICELANPTNCQQGTVTVTVTNTPPVVQDDSVSVVESSSGHAVDVLANDSDAEDGAPVVTVASGSSANGGSFNCTATGCSYTPVPGFTGTDSFTYEACDAGGECRTATVDVTVVARTLAITATPACIADAAYLDYSIAGGNFDATGLDATIEWVDSLGTVVQTLSNQPLSGQLLWPGMVLTGGVPTDWPGWVLTGGVWVQAADGFENVRPNATVRITVNPTQDVVVAYPPATAVCAAAPPANAAPLAVDDAGATVGVAPVTTDVLANDSDPEAGPLAVSIAATPGNGSVAVNADGSITYTPAAGFQGTDTYQYTITDAAGLTATATVTITVGWLPLLPSDDSATVASGAAGGTAVANVLGNDTLDGGPATLATVSLSQVSTTNPNVTLDVATGAVNVAPGTPAGTYTVVYEVCELANPANCEQASVTVTVGAAVIDAAADTGTVASGAVGGTAVADALANDTLGGSGATLATVSLSQTATTNPNVTLDAATGAVSVTPGTPAGTYTVTYQVCELLNPTNCDTASVTVTVGAAVIDAMDDTGTVASGAAGGTAVANVLVNDTLDGSPATLATVSLSQTATTNPNVTLDVATGAVSVAAGTPAGTYTVTYQSCELLNPANCDTASVTVTVGAAVIDAVDYTGTVASGAVGGTAVADVLANDTLGGSAATLATVSLAQTATTNPNVTLDVATGAVSVAAGTPAGTYTVTYQICELLNPTNCDTASVTVTVGAAVIDAVDDAGTVASGAAGGTAVANVLVNDTLDGSPATLANVSLAQTATTHPNVTMDPATGTVNVAAGTPAGTYTVTYQICELLNPTNCDTASVTVTVGAAVIDAVDDIGTVASGAAGGTAVANVLVNDTLGGSSATLANVSLAQTATTHPNVTLDPATGAVSVAAGTPAGTYTVTYQVCELLNPTNCDTASVTVTVGAAVIDAVDDAGTVASGAVGGTAVAYVLANDTLGGSPATLATVSLTQTATTHPSVTLDVATGAVNVAAGTPAGTYTVTYQICELLNPANCDTASVTVTVGAAVIDAVDDTGSVASGAAGGVPVANVLANDTLGGSPATLATVSLTQTATTHPNVTLDAATGAVSVTPGTPAGTYTVTYQICELLNPANCDAATASVTVNAAVIDAVDDTGTVASGAGGGTAVADVLANDTLGGSAATLATVSLSQTATTHPNVTLDVATGAVTVAPGTPAGTYTVTYQICELLNPANCDAATASATVNAAAIDATDDTGTVASGAAGGTAVANVLANDTLGGSAATLATVSLTQTATTNPNVTLDVATGAVSVTAGTPAGSYVVTYRICELLNPANCDIATATAAVDAAPIDAVDDAGIVANGQHGGIAVANVLGNDTLGAAALAPAQVSLSLVRSGSANVTLDLATGTVNVAPGTRSGTYRLTYEICELLNPGNCDRAVVVVRVQAAAIIAVDDAGSVASGAAGGTAVVDVLANDTLDGQPATLANVTLSQFATTTPGVTLDPATGAVQVAPGVAPGIHVVEYRICERLNPGNCDSAYVVVTVLAEDPAAPQLGLVDDEAGTPQDTPVRVPVLGNDLLGEGVIIPGEVTVSIASGPANGTVVIEADGSITYTPSLHFSGTDTFSYRVCRVAEPSVCDEAVVRVVVAPGIVTAPDQAVAGSQASPVVVPLYGVSTSTGVPLDPGSVQIVAPPAHGTVVVNADGSATYVPDPAFHGTDAFEYRVCDQSVPTPVCDTGRVVITVEMAAPQLRLAKSTPATTVRIGDYVRYEVVVENTGIAPATSVTVVDVPPAGFSYVEGSLTVQDADGVHGLAGTSPLRVTGVDIPAGGRATIGYLLRVGAGVGPGEHTNVVSAIDTTGSAVGNIAKIGVTLEGDPMVEESLVLGTVFLDANGDGRQQPGEPGLAGVRLATVEGLVVETDVRGRYHLAGLDGGNPLRGRNAILKVDVATLPPGSRFTTPNPLVRRITPGLPVRFDFGVQLPADGDATTPELR